MKTLITINCWCYESVDEASKRGTMAAEMAAASIIGEFAAYAAVENQKFYNSRGGGLYGVDGGFGWQSCDGSFVEVTRSGYRVIIRAEGVRSVIPWKFFPEELPGKLSIESMESSITDPPWIDGYGINYQPTWGIK
jgi:hypothetical protein